MASPVSSYLYYYTSPPSFSSSSSRPISLSSNPNNLSSSPSRFRHLSFQPKKGIRVPNSPPRLRVLCLCEPKVLRERERERESKMSGAVLVAVAAAMGNLLQGWDNATIAGKALVSPIERYAVVPDDNVKRINFAEGKI